MSRQAGVAIGGVHLAVTAWAEVAPHLAALGPFLRPTPAGTPLELRPLDAVPDLPRWRPDLAFGWLDGRLVAGTDASLGAFEAALQLALEACLPPGEGVLVHAAAGVVEGAEGPRAWLFPGPSGTGKSTCVRGGGFDAVLSDEICLLRRHPTHGFVVAGTPFWSDHRPLPLCDAVVPLGCIARLAWSPTPTAAPTGSALGVAALLRAVLFQRDDPAARAAAFHLVCDAALAVPTLDLAFPKEGRWLTAVRAAASRASSPKPSSGPCPSPCSGTSPGAATTSACTATWSTGTRMS